MGDLIEREAARALACEICGECDGSVDVCEIRDIQVNEIPSAGMQNNIKRPQPPKEET